MGRIADFLKTTKPTSESGIGPKEQLKEKIDAARETVKKLKAELSKAEGDAKVAVQRKIDGVSQTLKTYRKMYKEKFGESLAEEDGDSMANNGEMPTDGASKTKGFIKELIDTSWSGSNEEQMKAVQLLKGLATSDEPEANDFMKKVDDMMSGMKEEPQEHLDMPDEFEEAMSDQDKSKIENLRKELEKIKERDDKLKRDHQMTSKALKNKGVMRASASDSAKWKKDMEDYKKELADNKAKRAKIRDEIKKMKEKK